MTWRGISARRYRDVNAPVQAHHARCKAEADDAGGEGLPEYTGHVAGWHSTQYTRVYNEMYDVAGPGPGAKA
jgi:hypothetical protein